MEQERGFMDRVRGAGRALQAVWLILRMVGGAGMSLCRAAVAAVHIRLLRLIRGSKR